MKKFWIFLLVFLLAGSGVAAGTGVYLNQPEQVVRRALSDTVEGLSERNGISFLEGISEGSSVELRVEAKTSPYPLSLQWKSYLEENDFYLENFSAKAGVLDFQASAFAGEQGIWFSIPDFFSNKYGYVRGRMEQAFLQSPFAFGSGSKLAMDKAESNMTADLLRFYDAGKDTKLSQELAAYVTRYFGLFLTELEERAVYTERKESVLWEGEEYSTRIITVTIEDTDLWDALEAVLSECKQDKKLRKTAVKYIEDLKRYLVSEGLMTGIQNRDEAYDEVYDSLLKKLEDALNTAKTANAANPIRTKWSMELQTSPWSATARKWTFFAQTGALPAKQLLSVDFGTEGAEDTKRIALTLGEELTVAYVVEVDNRSAYGAKLLVEQENVSETVAELAWDKPQGVYDLTLGKTRISGQLKSKKGVTTLTVEKTVTNGTESDLLQLTLIVDCTASMPSTVPAWTEIKTVYEIPEQEREDLWKELDDLLMDLQSAFPSLNR